MTSNYFYIVILYYYTHNKYLNFLDIFNDDRRTKVSMKFSMLLGRDTSLKMLGKEEVWIQVSVQTGQGPI